MNWVNCEHKEKTGKSDIQNMNEYEYEHEYEYEYEYEEPWILHVNTGNFYHPEADIQNSWMNMNIWYAE